MRGALRGRAAFVLLALLAGCAPTPSQLVVSIDSDLPVDREPPTAGDGVLRAVRVIVCEERCEAEGPRDERLWAIGARPELGQLALPISFGVAPRDPDHPGSVEIVVDALRSVSGELPEDVLFSTSRRVTFTAGRVPVPIFLSAGCRGLACPEGTTCGDDGECTGATIDAGPRDAGLDAAPTSDAPTIDAHVEDVSALDAYVDDASAIDAPAIDAPVSDAPALDAPVLDAATFDAFSADATSCGAPPPMGPGGPTFTDGSDVPVTVVSSVSFAPDGSELVAGRGIGPFDVDGAHSDVSAYFVSRRGVPGSASWTTFFTYDPARRTPWSSIVRVLERDGLVYVAAQAAEAWTSGAVVIEEIPGSGTPSTRVGTFVLGLDATTGAARWGHSLKSMGPTEFLGGFTLDASGGWLITRWFGATPTSFRLDGATRRFDRGTVNGRVHLVHVDPRGAIDVVHGIDGPSFADVDVVSLGSDVLVALSGTFGSASPVTGLGDTLTDGEVALVRLTARGAFVWGTTLDCVSGSWSLRSLKLAAHDSRAFLAWSAGITSGGSVCTSLRVHDVGGATSHALPAEGSAWLGALAIDACTGAHDETGLWRARVNGSPLTAFTSLDADARGVAGTGYFGVGGADLGLGMLAGRDTGMGSDGFLLVFDHDLDVRHSRIFGARAPGAYTIDDGGEHVAIGHGALLLALAVTGAEDFDGVSIGSGGSVLRATLP